MQVVAMMTETHLSLYAVPAVGGKGRMELGGRLGKKELGPSSVAVIKERAGDCQAERSQEQEHPRLALCFPTMRRPSRVSRQPKEGHEKRQSLG